MTYDQFAMPHLRVLAMKKKVEEIGTMLCDGVISVAGALFRLSLAEYWVSVAFDDEIICYLSGEQEHDDIHRTV